MNDFWQFIATVEPKCEVCHKDIVLLSTGGKLPRIEGTGGVFNCALDENRLPCRHALCYSCIAKVQTGTEKLHAPK